MEFYESVKIGTDDEQEMYIQSRGRYSICIHISHTNILRTYISIELSTRLNFKKMKPITKEYFRKQVNLIIRKALPKVKIKTIIRAMREQENKRS